jgi:hypothetical protein
MASWSFGIDVFDIPLFHNSIIPDLKLDNHGSIKQYYHKTNPKEGDLKWT